MPPPRGTQRVTGDPRFVAPVHAVNVFVPLVNLTAAHYYGPAAAVLLRTCSESSQILRE